MKHTLIRLLTLSLLLCMMLSLVSCSSYNKILKDFEEAGYAEIDTEEGDDATTAKAIKAELEEGELTCTVHILKKGEGLSTKYAIILEFTSDEELAKAFAEDGSATLKGVIEDAQDSPYVNGNCILIPSVGDLVSSERTDLFAKSKK